MKRFFLVCMILIVAFCTVQAQNPEPTGWYSGDMHAHRSCGGSPESVATMFNRMTPQNLAVESLLADSGNGEVQDAATDLPLVNGQDDATVSTPNHILHWDTEWHWDAIYTQYPHQALGGHIVNLGLSSAQQIWQENTFPILDWAHQHNGIAGFAHMQYLDGNGLPSTLTCCTPIEYPVEVALGAADFISEDVNDVNQTNTGVPMYSETPLQAYYKLLNSGFRPGLAAGTDYPCNNADNGGALGGLLTYVQIPGGQLTYHDWVQGIANGRTVVSRNGHNEFLSLTVNGTKTPGDEIDIAAPGNVSVTVQWTAGQNWSGTIELVQNGIVVASLPTSVSPGTPATLTTTVNFAKSGWLAARRMGTNPKTGNYEHYLHTGAVFVVVNNAPIRASQADAQYFVNWTSGLLQKTSPGGIWNSYFPTSLAQTQARYQAAEALYQQIASEASGSGPTLNSIAVTPSNQTIGVGSQLSFSATGTYSSGPALNITGQVRWTSSNSSVATISTRGLVSAIGPGSAVISATLSGKTSGATLTVTTSPLVISTTSLAAGTVGVLYSSTVAATGGTLPYAWSIASGSLPTGLTLNVNSGLISGTPSAAGTFNFVVRANDSGSPTQAVSQALSITIGAPGACPCSIWPSSTTPQVADAGPDSPVELGVQFRSDFDGYITGVRFYKSAANTGTHVGNLWTSGGTQLATATFTGESASGWQQVNFSTPVAVTAGTVYVASYHSNSGHYAADLNYFASQGVDNSPLHAPQDTSTTPNGVFVYGAGGFPNQTWTSSNYWVDVVFAPSGTTPLTITTQSLPGGIANVAYSGTLAASGGTTPYTWSIASGSLPTGLTLNGSTGAISGTPAAAGTFNFVVQAGDSSNPAQTASKGLSIIVTAVSGGCPCSIWPNTATPTVTDGGPDSSVEVGVQFRSDVNGYITGVRFYKSAANTGSHVGNLWTSGGTQLATATFTGESASGWQQVNFSAPVAVTAGTVYVASYHTSTGHYAYDTNSFTNQGVDNSPLHAVQNTPSTPNGVFAYGLGSFPNGTWNSTNYWVDVVFLPAGPDTTPPTVQSVTPTTGASGVDPLSSITATFSEAMDPTTVSGSSVQLLDSSSSVVAATVTYNSATNTATLRPNAALLNSTTYSVILKGGIIKDVAGNALTSDYTWSFTTSAPTPPPPPDGPGGPILIVSSTANPFSRYYTEILRNEGFNEFTAMDVSQVSGSTLASYEVVILGTFELTPAQASMFTTWVNNGGNLIAMRPDKQLASVLGLADTGTVLSDAYLLINTTSGPGSGLVNDTIQFHGNADRYAVNGATSLATLYSSATAATSNPAVTLNQVGLGQAAAFTYDLAKSVVYTRQGNPAWSGQARDGQAGPIRSDDLYYGDASFDPEPDYVDHDKIAIPQADEQQRLLANLIIQMNLAKQPLPRFWYFPHDLKAAVVLTGDDHGAMYGGGVTAARFDHYQSFSPSGCSVSDWQCVRASAYLIAPSVANNPLTNAQAASYIAQGFEVGVHIDSVPDCSNWTPSELASFYSSQISSFRSVYTSVPQSKTHRMHCIGWSDYDSQPQTELQNGIRLDTSYYYWPPSWVNDTPGMFTGSGMPMRFTKMDGTMLDIYQAATQMTDESGQSYPLHIDTLLDNAIGANGYYGYFTANMHNDFDPSDGADAVIASAQSRGVPIISAAQLLTWLDGRNGSSFTSQSWSGSTLTFGIAVGSGANGLEAMLPANRGTATLQSLTLNGSPASFTLETIKGISYAVFPASAGTYQASYSATSSVNIASVTMNPSTTVGGNSSTGTVNLNGPAPAGGVQISLTTSDSATASLSSSTVTVPQGGTTATFTVNTNIVAATTNVVISAMYGGNTVSSNLTITPGATVTSLALNPTTVVGGTSSTATVTLNNPAPSGGVVVNLSSSNTAAAQVPATITIGAGATTATFTVTTASVITDASLTISAILGTTQNATFTVRTAALSSVTLNPTSVSGGNNSTGTLTLSGPAPAGGALVTLLSSNTAAAQVPASVTVSAGQSSATFAVTTSTVATNASLTISATYGSTQTAGLTVTAAAASTVTLNPISVPGGATSTATVTLNGPAPTGGAIVTLSSNNTAAAQVPASVTVAAGATTAVFTVTTSVVSANTTVTVSATYGATRTATLTVMGSLSTVTVNPTSVIGGTSSTGTVILAAAAPTGGAVVALSSSNTTAAQVPGSVTVAAGATSATFTITTSGVASNASVTISGTYGVTKTATLTVTAAALSTVTLSPTSVIGGTSSTGTVRLTGPAPAAGVVVTLSSSNTVAAQVPATVTVPGGATTATFTITTSGVASNASATISGTYGVTKTAPLTVTAAALSTVTLSPTTVIGGTSSTGTVLLTGQAPAGGAVVALSSSNTVAAQVPATVTVPGGATTATFTITTSGVASNASATISGTYGVTRTATLTVTTAALSTLTLSPTTVIGGTSSTGTVLLTGQAPAGGAVVTLSSSNTVAAQVPATVTVPGGATTATFTITTAGSVSNASVTISGTYGVRRTATLTVTASQTPVTITASSSTINWGDAVPVITASATGLIAPDTIATLAPVCTTTYTMTSNAGTYPTTCSGATNPGNKYVFTYVAGKITVNPIRATMISPLPGSTFTSNSQTFTWTTGGATNYALWVSAVAPGGREIFQLPTSTATFVTVNNLPITGKTLYVRLYTSVNGAWQFYDYTYYCRTASEGGPHGTIIGTHHQFTGYIQLERRHCSDGICLLGFSNRAWRT